ncbi:LysR family transcriptional regulator [Streptomyces misionensis]|uniref:LysR family transcriptional regulator n=1 Tax=Streptomyces misionensis TaxID=67331 RepID=UPI001646B1C8|nr:LysR family transcriptional regulator [Streptomyces misionensis]
MRRDLDIRPLRTLVTIVDVGGFRRASRVLSISQPAVSQHIRRLDALIGEPVFRETGPSLVLSAGGEELLRFARQLVRTNDELVTRLSAHRSTGRLALGVCETLVGVIPTLLAELKAHVSLVDTSVLAGPGDELTDQLAEGAIDMLLKVGEPGKDADRVIGAIECAWFGERALLDDASLPLAVFAGRTTPLRQLAEETLTCASRPWHVVYKGVGVEDVVGVCRSGVGVSLLFAAAEDRWNLPVVPRGRLPEPARHLPVIVAAGPRLAPGLAGQAREAVEEAMGDYTCTAAEPGHMARRAS